MPQGPLDGRTGNLTVNGLHCLLFLLTLLPWLIAFIFLHIPFLQKAWKMEAFAHATIAGLCISSENAVDCEYRKLQISCI